MFVRADAIETTQGEPERFDITLPDGRVKRGCFCSRCATRLWGEPLRLPGFAVLRPGTLDDTSWVIPIGHIWTASAQSWLPIPDGPTSIAGQPEGDETIALARAWKERGK